MKSNRRFYVPYILTVIGTAAAFYIMAAIVSDPGSKELAAGTANGQVYVSMFMTLGMVVLGLFSFIFLLYTNSFLMKRRQKELGLYSVLGMSKTNIAGIMVFESLYIAVIGIAGGLAGRRPKLSICGGMGRRSEAAVKRRAKRKATSAVPASSPRKRCDVP